MWRLGREETSVCSAPFRHPCLPAMPPVGNRGSIGPEARGDVKAMSWLKRLLRKSTEWRVAAFLIFVAALILIRYLVVALA